MSARQLFSAGPDQGDYYPGMHVCQIYNTGEERLEILHQFIEGGISYGDLIACFTPEALGNQLVEYAVQLQAASNSLDTVEIHEPLTTYLHEGQFDPDRMLDKIREFYRHSQERNLTSARIIGDMPAQVFESQGGDRVMEYEARVSLLQEEIPVTTVCQYEAGSFSGETIMEVLQVHPYILTKGSIIQNPLYIDPRTYLAR
jgi:hypothetical protein